MLAGASGYVLKDVRSRSLVEAIRRAATGAHHPAAGGHAACGQIIEPRAQLPRRPGPRCRSGRARCISLIADGLTNREIGERLGLAEKTVKNYVSGLLAKLGMERRTQAAVYGAERRQRAE